jgi:phosphopantothenoylcysteine decarboxylase/phosphopantothenate--cysteine ligase
MEEHPSMVIKGTESSRLKGKRIVLALTGSVAVVRSFELCRGLMRRGASVKVVMSAAALRLLGRELMEYASGEPVITEITGRVEHVGLLGIRGKADLLLIAPATANTISKVAMGIDDTPASTMATTAIGAERPVIIAPAMHYSMYKHPIVQQNLSMLQEKGFVRIVQPMVSEDKAKFADAEHICLECERALSGKGLEGKRVLVVSGRSYEKVDEMRVLTNNASGKTGLEIAKEAYRQGAEVCLIHNCVKGLPFVQRRADAYREFFTQVMDELSKGYDIMVCPAALNDFRPERHKGKIKSGGETSLSLKPNRKLLAEARRKYPKLFIAGFKAEALSGKALEGVAVRFMKENRLQMVVANDIRKFPVGSGKNGVTIFSGRRKVRVSGRKDKIAERVVAEAANRV